MRRSGSMVTAALIAWATSSFLPGCGGKYDKPLELSRVIRMGEYTYQPAYRGFDMAVGLAVTGGSLYVAYADTSAQPAPGAVRAYFSGGSPVPGNLVKDFAGLTKPIAIGAGKRAIAVADLAGSLTVRVYGLSGGSPIVSFSDTAWVLISALAVDDSGNIYVADAAKNFVRSYKPNGKPRFEVDLADSGFGIGHVLRPTGLAIDNETLLISEGHPEKAQVQRIRIDRPQTGIPLSAESPFISAFMDPEGNETPLVEPVGVAAGQEGSIFILDKGLGRVFRFDSQGNSIAVVNSPASGGPEDVSNAVSVGSYNRPGLSASIYVLDPVKGLVHRWDPK